MLGWGYYDQNAFKNIIKFNNKNEQNVTVENCGKVNFFKDMRPGMLAILQWVAIYRCIYGKHKLD